MATMWRTGAAAAALALTAAVAHTPPDWCLPAEVTMAFEGHWHGLVLWGALPTFGPVKGRMTVAQNDTHTLNYMRYTIAGEENVFQEQWAVWQRGGRAITIGKNSTADGTASSCALIEDEPADDSNDPRFCSRTAEIELKYDGNITCGGSSCERWVFNTSEKTPNSTLTLIMQRPDARKDGKAARWSAVPCFSIAMPLYHMFHDNKDVSQYYVDHFMMDFSPDVDYSVFAAMPEPSSCDAQEDGAADSSAEVGPDADVRTRSKPKYSGIHAARPRHASAGNKQGGGCPYGFDRSPRAQPPAPARAATEKEKEKKEAKPPQAHIPPEQPSKQEEPAVEQEEQEEQDMTAQYETEPADRSGGSGKWWPAGFWGGGGGGAKGASTSTSTTGGRFARWLAEAKGRLASAIKTIRPLA